MKKLITPFTSQITCLSSNEKITCLKQVTFEMIYAFKLGVEIMLLWKQNNTQHSTWLFRACEHCDNRPTCWFQSRRLHMTLWGLRHWFHLRQQSFRCGSLHQTLTWVSSWKPPPSTLTACGCMQTSCWLPYFGSEKQKRKIPGRVNVSVFV